MNIVSVQSLSDPLRELLTLAFEEATQHRGGPALLDELQDGASFDELVQKLVASCSLFVDDIDSPKSFSIVLEDKIWALYVTAGLRRNGQGREMLKALLALANPPVDAVALPGDRATKSLYESVGWKARQLTMRGE